MHLQIMYIRRNSFQRFDSMKLFQIVCFIFISSSISAEIRVTYEVFPLQEHPLVDTYGELPQKVSFTLGDQFIREDVYKSPLYSEFYIYTHNDDYYAGYFSSAYGRFKFEDKRFFFDVISQPDSLFRVEGYQCKKVIAQKDGITLKLYHTDQFGVGFHPDIENLPGIPVLFSYTDEIYGEIVYKLSSLETVNLPSNYFDYKGYKNDPESKKKPVDKEVSLLKTKLPNLRVKSMANSWTELTLDSSKVTVINFWFNGSPCTQEIPYLNEMVKMNDPSKVQFIAISTDNGSVVKEALSIRSFNFKHFSNGSQAAKKLKVDSFPTTLVIDQKGTIQLVTGFNPRSTYEIHQAIQETLNNP